MSAQVTRGWCKCPGTGRESGLNVLITVYISAVRNVREKTYQNKGQVQARERKNPGGMGALGTAEVGKELQ